MRKQCTHHIQTLASGRSLRATRSRGSGPRSFQTTTRRRVVRPFILSDPGEGIKEVQIIQWFVEPGARVEQFTPICEIQSDKSINEITSRFDGVIKKLHYEKDDVIQVGQALLDIDVQGEIPPGDEPVLAPEPSQGGSQATPTQPQKAVEQPGEQSQGIAAKQSNTPKSAGKYAALATPAVRGLLKEHDVKIGEVTGTGKDGRIMKEDVQKYIAAQLPESTQTSYIAPSRIVPSTDDAQVEKAITLAPVQRQMFKTMTRSLSIPHFLYADEVELDSLSSIRRRLNSQTGPQKLSYLHFIIKAVSLALEDFPLLNARVATGDEQNKPQIVMREKHNIGFAVDTEQGLLVPNIKNVSSRSILDIAAEACRLQSLAREGKLSSKDLTGGTITVSNIGSIGGTYVAPVIVQSEVAILGVGKTRTIPAFDEEEKVVKKEIVNFSWSADHRVIDGATMARMAERVKAFVERPELMIARLR